MALLDVIEVGAAFVLSLGGGGAIVALLSSWLGKVWANRLMEADRARYATDLERVRADLMRKSEIELSSIKNELEILRTKHLKGHFDKLLIYRMVINIVADFLADITYVLRTSQPPPGTEASYDRFNRGRLKAYGYLAMLALKTL